LDRGSCQRSRTNRDYLLDHTPDRAPALIRRVYNAATTLLTFPNRGRPGKKEGTRELLLAPLPYIVVYVVRGDVIFVVRILHGAQHWP